ncbi:Hsp70 family protein [Streptomyces sp. NPDC021020]|uniref:Hsp70 family protein n=1 Tax=Streptomyces sp. NPDC021020 TaxID=3365109 RepID=UPI00379073C3
MNTTPAGGDIKIAAAVDFGTHGTGFAWSVIEPLNDVAAERAIVRSSYKPAGRYEVTRAKDLSAVLTDASGAVADWGHSARARWLHMLEAETTQGWGYATGYKMALRADTGEMGVAQALGTADIHDTAAVRALVTGCLAKVRAAAEENMAASGFLPHQVRWCLTVPAIWDEAEKQLMREAAVAAGFPDDEERLLLAYEPEAAAITAYLSLALAIDGTGQTDRVPLMKAGTRFMVVDCGGGTVDITAYESLKDGTIRLAEIGAVCGGRLGSEFLDHAFRTELLADRLGADLVSRLAATHPDELQRMADQWETHKIDDLVTVSDEATGELRLAESGYLWVEVPGAVWELLGEDHRQRLTAASGRRYRLEFTAAEVQRVFDGLVDPILAQIDEQLAAMARTPAKAPDAGGAPQEYLLLVGGFSGSSYLRERIHRRFGDRIRILRPAYHDCAVLDGAVHYAYDPGMVASHQARFTYGVALCLPWEERDGAERRGVVEGQALCGSRFRVAVVRGQTVEVDEHVEVPDLRPVNRKDTEVKVEFYRTRDLDPRYTDASGCQLAGTVTVPVPRHFRRRSSTDSFTLRMYFGDTQIRVEMRDDRTGTVTKGTVAFARMR